MTPRALITQGAVLQRNPAHRVAPAPAVAPAGEIPGLLDELARERILTREALAAFCKQDAAKLRECQTRERFCAALLEAGLISQYQLGRIVARQSASLKFGAYLLRERIAAGSIGVVFRAEHAMLKRPVAIKMLNADEATPPHVVERFHYEGLLLGQVAHPNVVGILDAGTVPALEGMRAETHYLALEFVDGTDVEEHVYAENRPLDVEPMCDLMAQVAWGLAAVHEKGILHRDIKPSNMLISKSGEVKIVDFGIGLDTKKHIDYGEKLLGSLDFMPLEQSLDAAHATPASDVYALGVSCFWLLTGHTPLPQAKSIEEALQIIREGAFRRVRQYRNDVPPELDGSLMRMLERDPRRRLAAARDAAVLLERFSRRRLLHAGAAEDKSHASVAHSSAGKSLVPAAPGREEAVYLSLLAALEIKDQCGPRRGKRLTESLTELTRALQKREYWNRQLDPATLAAMGWAVRLLDVAMLFSSERLFGGKSLLTREELELQKNHPTAGGEFLERVVREVDPQPVFLKAIRQIVEAHHERHDGTGTPKGTKGEETPAAARIVSVLDAYEELRRTRKTKVGLGHEEAVRLLLTERAAHCDPWVLIAFQECEAKISSIYANYADAP